MLLVGAFYLVPSVQFVTFQATTPQVDCYYNYKCKHDLGYAPAFNNIASNFLYIVAGIAFYITVLVTRPRRDGHTGLHSDMSLYYSLAIVLCLEGIFSGLYHVCPSRLNFQFDSTFMMIGVALLFVTIFQKRHAARSETSLHLLPLHHGPLTLLLLLLLVLCRTIGAVRFYAFLSFLTFANSVTLFTGAIGTLIWIAVFSVIAYVLVAGSVHIYYHKNWKLDLGLPKRGFPTPLPSLLPLTCSRPFLLFD